MHNKSVKLLWSCGCLFCGCLAAYGWNPQGGDYTIDSKASFGGDMRTVGQTGDQTYTLTVPREVSAFWPGASDTTAYWQIFRGEGISVSYKATDLGGWSFRVMGGNVAIENAVRSSGGQNYVGFVYPVQLVLRNGGSLFVDHANLEIAKFREASPTANGLMYMEEPSQLVASDVGIYVGAGNKGGLLWMDGGSVSLTNGVLKVGTTDGSSVGGGNGYLRVNGGTISLRSDADSDSKQGLSVGAGYGYSSLHLTGGSIVSRCSAYTSVITARSSLAKDAVSDVYLEGGVLDLKNLRTTVGAWNAAGKGRASLTVDGTAYANIALIGLGCIADNGGVSCVNLNGGTLRFTKGFADYGKKSERWFNLNGGTLEFASGVKLGAKPSAVVYPRGATLHVPSGESGVISSVLSVAGGWGVESIALANGGSGYVTAPQVTISGGSGSNATAYAVLNKAGSVERLAVTCRGEGYASGDVLTVTISGATGSGATAGAVTLTENTLPTITKTGAGDLRATGNVAFAGALEVAEGDLSAESGASLESFSRIHLGDGVRLCPTRAQAQDATDVMSINRLDLSGGLAYEYARVPSGYKGLAKLAIGTFSREPDGLLATTEDSTLVSIAETEHVSATSAHPLVNGLIALGGTTLGQRVLHAYERDPATGELSLADWSSDAPCADKGFFTPGAETTYDCSAVNAVYIPWQRGGQVYFRNNGPVEIVSGMILDGQNSASEFSRVGVTGTGACLTTQVKGGMLIYADSVAARSYSSANNDVVLAGNSRHLIIGSLADPSASQPMPVTVAGPRPSRPDKGSQAWLIGGNNDFSGGLYLLNGGVVIDAENGLGRAGCPVSVRGLSMISLRNGTPSSVGDRPVCLHDGSALMFSSEKSGIDFRGAFEGSGDLLTGDISLGQVMSFGGDHSKFTGTYYIYGRTRMASAAFSEQAGVCLADGTNGVGVIETSGAFTRAPGTGKGQVCWRNHATLAAYGLKGGFAALGGALTVNLGNDGRKLAPGSDYLPDDAVIQLQSSSANAALTFANGFALDGHVQKISVSGTQGAALTGAVSDATGGGRLDVRGSVAFSGTLEVSSATLAADAPLLTVEGSLDLTGAQVDFLVPAAELTARGEEPLAIASATAGVTGLPTAKAALPDGWKLKVRRGQLLLDRVRGMTLIIR